MKNIKFNKEYLKFLVPQRTRISTEYSISEDSPEDKISLSVSEMAYKDFNMINPFIPSETKNILDIGCGLGLIDVLLYDYYKNTNLHLLDKTNDISKDTSIRGFNKEYIFYNSMDATKEILMTNGVPYDKIYIYETTPENLKQIREKKYELIISLLSCGWHYPIETYVDLIKNTLTKDGILILDIRHNTGQLEYAKQHFELIDCVINTMESKHTGGTIGDRYFFKNK
jgi:SAM-dependent methyltransferase